MRIGYDARLTAHGIGRVTEDLLAHVARKNQRDEFIALTASEETSRKLERIAPNIRGSMTYAKIHSVTEQVLLPFWLLREKIDLFHATSFPAPVLRACPLVVTIHDQIPRLNDAYWPPLRGIKKPLARAYYRAMNWYSINFSAHIITVSKQAKDEIRRFHPNVPEDKITVVYNAAGAEYKRAGDAEITDVRNRYRLPQNYFLFVGTFNPRKNLLGVMRAIVECRQLPGWKHKLAVAARKDERYPEIGEFIRRHNLEDSVVLLNYVDRSDLPAIYSGATALVFPSYHESYGIPVVEAFACGTPVITSNTSALPEVAGEAALYVNPADTGELNRAMLRVISDTVLRERLVSGGYRRAQLFSWDRAADQVLDIYRRMSGSADVCR